MINHKSPKRKLTLIAISCFAFFTIGIQLPAFSQNTLQGYGDSNTYGWGATAPQYAWFNLVTSELGILSYNYGVPGSTIYGTSGFDAQRANAATNRHDYATIAYGTNDAYNLVIDDQWKADYERMIKESFLDIGYDRNEIILIAPLYPSSSDKTTYIPNLQKIHDYDVQIAQELGIKFIDLFTIMQQQPQPLSWYADEFHLSNYGHRLLANLVEAQISTKTLPIKAGSLKVVRNSDGTFTASFVASETTHTKEFILKYSEDGKNFKQIWHLFPERLQQEKQYTFTFSIN